ncbi:hypothetical protein R3P38DRAFT_3174208 [Favolaschia claudopus]|uniref:Uncharacterized protein n=1 Tax=Favolaschia claudopus TaxID=2862362 RepID=A0AAW0DHP0_9AGAR
MIAVPLNICSGVPYRLFSQFEQVVFLGTGVRTLDRMNALLNPRFSHIFTGMQSRRRLLSCSHELLFDNDEKPTDLTLPFFGGIIIPVDVSVISTSRCVEI